MQISKIIKNKVFGDMALNIIATAIPTFVIQIILLPLLGRRMDSNEYGLLVTILALLNVVPSTFGNTLNNIRLIYDRTYKIEKVEGDFNLILLLFTIFNILITGFLSIYYDKEISIISLVLTVLVSIVWLAKEYFIVAFRIDINYKAILINNILHVIGYGVGYGLYIITDQWQLIYLCGYTFGLIYIFLRCNLWKEPLKFTRLFKNVTIQAVLLLVAGILMRMTVYADKLLLYPLIGGNDVSVYYVATFFGKIVALVVTPVTSVLLTYLTKEKEKQESVFVKTIKVGTVICILGYLGCILLSRPILGFLYPQYVDDAMNYIFITSATTVIYTMITIVNPFILKFYDMWWQIAINAVSVVTYVVLSIGLLKLFGLMGFCFGAMISNIIKLLFSFWIYYKALPRKK